MTLDLTNVDFKTRLAPTCDMLLSRVLRRSAGPSPLLCMRPDAFKNRQKDDGRSPNMYKYECFSVSTFF